jgi:8-oxo-dGTP pyrophosphatase MutT (NUDIX family)
VTSATAKFAGAIATFAFQMITNFDWLGHLRPRSDQRQSALAFDVNGARPSKDTSFASESIFGQITGKRATLIIGDDLETPNTSDTEGNRAELRKRIGEFGAIILPGGDILYLGTPQVEQTIYRELAEEKGYECRIYPILYPVPHDDLKKDELRRYGHRLAPILTKALAANPDLAGTSTEPTRFSEPDILARRTEWGTTEFDRQFRLMLDAGTGRGNPLKLRDLIALEIPPPQEGKLVRLPADLAWSPLPAAKWEGIEVDALNGDSQLYAPIRAEDWVEAEGVHCHIDPSGEGSDETTWTIGAQLLGRVALLWQGKSLEGHTPATMTAIAKDCKTWQVQTASVEDNFGQGMFAQLLRPVMFDEIKHPCSIDGVRFGQVQKERRIVDTLEPVTSSHRLLINVALLRDDFVVEYEDIEQGKRRYYRLSYQFTRMTKKRGCVPHDDRVDGLAGLVSKFVDVLQQALKEAARAGKVKAIEEEAEKIIEARRAAGLPLFGLDEKPRFGRRRGRHT